MVLRGKSLTRPRLSWPPLLAGAGLALIVGWLLFGSTGLFAWSDYSRALSSRSSELQEMRTELAALENRQRLLNPQRVDPDLSEELIRRDLNMLHPDEIIVPLN